MFLPLDLVCDNKQSIKLLWQSPYLCLFRFVIKMSTPYTNIYNRNCVKMGPSLFDCHQLKVPTPSRQQSPHLIVPFVSTSFLVAAFPF